MEQIGKVDEALGARIQDLMFVFDDLMRDRRPRHAGSCCARCRATAAARAEGRRRGAEGEDLQEHVAARGRDAARTTSKPRARCASPKSKPRRRKSCAIARKLAEAGTIQLGGKGEEYV